MVRTRTLTLEALHFAQPNLDFPFDRRVLTGVELSGVVPIEDGGDALSLVDIMGRIQIIRYSVGLQD